jgi:hypothetical protein
VRNYFLSAVCQTNPATFSLVCSGPPLAVAGVLCWLGNDTVHPNAHFAKLTVVASNDLLDDATDGSSVFYCIFGFESTCVHTAQIKCKFIHL